MAKGKLNKKTVMAKSKGNKKTALLIYCTQEEAEKIRLAAKRERRTITGFVMNAVMSRFVIEGRIQERKQAIAKEIVGASSRDISDDIFLQSRQDSVKS